MGYRYTRATVIRNPMEKIRVDRPAHEIDILKSLYGDDSVTDEEHHVVNGAEENFADPVAERERLSNQYGVHTEAKIPHADLVYGRGQELAKAIKEHTVEDVEQDEFNASFDEDGYLAEHPEADPEKAGGSEDEETETEDEE